MLIFSRTQLFPFRNIYCSANAGAQKDSVTVRSFPFCWLMAHSNFSRGAWPREDLGLLSREPTSLVLGVSMRMTSLRSKGGMLCILRIKRRGVVSTSFPTISKIPQIFSRRFRLGQDWSLNLLWPRWTN